MLPLLRRLIGTEDGQDIVEYALLLALIAFICIAAVGGLGGSVSNAIGNADTQLRSDGGI